MELSCLLSCCPLDVFYLMFFSSLSALQSKCPLACRGPLSSRCGGKSPPLSSFLPECYVVLSSVLAQEDEASPGTCDHPFWTIFQHFQLIKNKPTLTFAIHKLSAIIRNSQNRMCAVKEQGFSTARGKENSSERVFGHHRTPTATTGQHI